MDPEKFDLDHTLKKLGHFGMFQKINFSLLFIPVLLSALYTISYVFTAEITDYRCRIPECDKTETSQYIPEWLPNAVPYKGGLPEKCSRYHPIQNTTLENNTCPIEYFDRNITDHCNDFVFASEKSTISNDFEIFCDNNLWKLTLVGTINNVGQLICLPLNGLVSDKYGRRNALVIGLLLSALFGLARSFSASYIWFLSFEFLDPLLGSGAYSSAFILGMELVDPSKRVLGSTIICSAYAFGEAIIGIVAWTTESWRTFLQIIYAPGLLIILYFWLVPESVRWLMTQKRYDEVESIIKSAAKMNNITLSTDALTSLQSNRTSDNNKNIQIMKAKTPIRNDNPIKEVFTDLYMMLRILNCSICWITCNFVFYGLSLNSVAIAGNPYANFIAVSLVEVPGYISIYFILDRFGRRFTLCGSLLLSGCACIGFIFIPAELQGVKLTLFLIGKFAITITFTALYVFTTELFHTPVRHSLMGFCSMLGKTGAILAPQAPLLAQIWEPFPLLLYGLMSILSGILGLLFPETLNTKLPDTLEEAKDIGKMPNTRHPNANRY